MDPEHIAQSSTGVKSTGAKVTLKSVADKSPLQPMKNTEVIYERYVAIFSPFCANSRQLHDTTYSYSINIISSLNVCYILPKNNILIVGCQQFQRSVQTYLERDMIKPLTSVPTNLQHWQLPRDLLLFHLPRVRISHSTSVPRRWLH